MGKARFAVAGGSGFPKVVLAREPEMRYAAMCYVSNYAAGAQQRLTTSEVSSISGQIPSKAEKVLIETVKSLHLTTRGNYLCAAALKNARIK